MIILFFQTFRYNETFLIKTGKLANQRQTQLRIRNILWYRPPENRFLGEKMLNVG